VRCYGDRRSDHEIISSDQSKPWTAALVLVFVALGVPPGGTATAAERVLLLHSFGREFAPYDAIVASFRTDLAKGSIEPIATYDVALDAGQPPGFDDPQPLIELLRQRFAGSPPDLVVTFGPPAANFYLKNRDAMFPRETRLVITALDVRFLRKSELRAGDAALAVHQDLPRSVSNILQLLPDTTQIAVVIGDSPLERFWVGELRREFVPFANRVNFDWLNDLSLEQVHRRVASLPAHSAVLYTMMLTDGAGVPHEGKAALASVLEASAAPVFSIHGSELGRGVVGGPYHLEQQQGARAAAMALRVLSGQVPIVPTIEVENIATPVYDWRALKRWGIDFARLPAGSEIRFRPPSLWDEHSTLIVTAISIFVLQAALSIGLVWQRIRRRRAEAEAQALSGRLITAHEDERRWLARELHDDITQRLAGLAIDAAKLPGGDPSTSDQARRSIRAGLAQLSEDVHDLSYRLHPSVLDDLGLVEALKSECERVARSESVRVDVEAEQLPQKLPKDVTLVVYRVAQEALRNVGRHAQASAAKLSLALCDDGLRLAVSDNGSGFEPDLQPRRPSLGHASMRERIRLVGGRLDIQSSPGEGTMVVAWVPIPRSPA
jgi:signal transduction histidine kinase